MEIEVKIKVDDFKALKDKILAQGARLVKDRYFEDNTLYDLPSGKLYENKQALRLRTINKKTFLTYKGEPHKSRKFKIREEYESEVKNRKDIKKILKSLKFSPVYKYEKYRTVYRFKKLEICLDETSVGNFIELEGQRSDIVRFAQALGFSKKQLIKADYIQLMEKGNRKD